MATKKTAGGAGDKLTRKVQIEMDGKSWPLFINHNVLIDCEELTGLNLLAGEANLLRPSAKLVRGLLFLCLKRAGAPYSLEQVGEMIHPQNIVVVQEALLNAWAASMPEREPETEDPTAAASE